MPIPRENNISIVRYILATIIFYNQFITYMDHGWLQIGFGYEVVGCFFALSGFFVFKTYSSSQNFKEYAVRRMRRLLPPYVFIVVICAVGLCAFSTLSAEEYFTSAGFWKYLGANLLFLNFLHPSLPGVFLDISSTMVNPPLWTMKLEWLLFFIAPLLFSNYSFRNRIDSKWRYISFYVASVLLNVLCIEMMDRYGLQSLYPIKKIFWCGAFYFSGAMIYHYFDFFKRSKWKICISALVVVLIASEVDIVYATLFPAALTALLLAVCFTGRWGSFVGNRSCISYEIYLFHLPVFQIALTLAWNTTYGIVVTCLICVAITLAMSVFSHRFISAPFLPKKSR